MNQAGPQSQFRPVRHLWLLVLSSLIVFGLVRLAVFRIGKSHQNDYLVDLRESSTNGCSSFYGKDLDLFVLGDSHSYAGFDYLTLKELSGLSNISSCTMGGLYFESALQILRKMAFHKSIPKILIYGASLRQFTSGNEKEAQINEHEKLIKTAFGSPFSLFANDRELLTKYIFEKSSNSSQNRKEMILKWTPVFESLPEEKLKPIVENTFNLSRRLWDKYLAQLKFDQDSESRIDQFCKIVTQSKIKLIVVDIPENPLLDTKYKASDRAHYHNLLNRFKSCSNAIIQSSTAEWGLGFRHFVNRSLSDQWTMADLTSASASVQDMAFDLDHLNLVGAQIFTRQFYDRIKSELSHAF